MKKRLIMTSAVLCAAIMLMMPFLSADRTAFAVVATTKNLNPGSTWVVNETTTLTSLTISGGVMKAPEGYSLTMTVDGVKTAIKAGAYKGKIVLTVTKS